MPFFLVRIQIHVSYSLHFINLSTKKPFGYLLYPGMAKWWAKTNTQLPHSREERNTKNIKSPIRIVLQHSHF